MGRPKGAKNRRTLLREAEERLKRTRDPNEVVDMLHVIGESATHFYLRAEMSKHSGTRTPKEIDEDYREAAALASLALSARPVVGYEACWRPKQPVAHQGRCDGG
jgi:hypothetical protein